jgi:hypothetical protein
LVILLIKNKEGYFMDNQFMNSLKELHYASLSSEQEARLREFERQFNNEFGTAVYFMVMDREKENQNPGL